MNQQQQQHTELFWLLLCRHTSRFLICYLTVLPLLLWPMSGWASPVLSVVIAFLLLGVENIGAFIEEPFHVRVIWTAAGGSMTQEIKLYSRCSSAAEALAVQVLPHVGAVLAVEHTVCSIISQCYYG